MEDVLAHGTADPFADVAGQARLSGKMGSIPRTALRRRHSGRLAVASAWPSNRFGLRVIVFLCVRGTRGAIRE